MAKQTIAQLKQWFRTNLYPTQSQFYDWFDSYLHKDDAIPMAKVTGLVEMLQTINNNNTSEGSIPPIVLAGTNTCTIPAGTKVDSIIIIDTQEAVISLGTTNGANDLIQDVSVEPPHLEVEWTRYFPAQQDIYFTGMNTTTVIKIYRR